MMIADALVPNKAAGHQQPHAELTVTIARH